MRLILALAAHFKPNSVKQASHARVQRGDTVASIAQVIKHSATGQLTLSALESTPVDMYTEREYIVICVQLNAELFFHNISWSAGVDFRAP